MSGQSRYLAVPWLFAWPASAPFPDEDIMDEITYPRTERVDVVEEHFGHTITDPYRWLEADARTSDAVADWVAAQNAVTDAHLSALPGRDIFSARLSALLDFEQYGVPVKRRERYFFIHNPGQANQFVLTMREGKDGGDRVLIDPNSWSADSADALGEWAVSPDGTLVAYGVQIGGTDWRTIRVLEVDTGVVREDEVQWARFMQIAWAPDGSGFFYSRFPAPDGGATSGAGIAGHAVYFHALGTEQQADRLIHADPERPAALHIAETIDDGQMLVISSTPGAGVNGVTVVDLAAADWTPRTLVSGFDHEWSVIGRDGDRLIVMTSAGAERRRVVTLDLAESDPQPVEIVPEDAAVLSQAAVLGRRILASYLVDARTEVRRFALDGTPEGTVVLPGIGTAGAFGGRSDDNEAFFIFTSFDAPTGIYRYDVTTGSVTAWARPEVAADLDALTVEQRFYASRDGTKVPMFIVRRKDASGPAPTLLYGYGGFGISMVPIYNPAQIAWIEQGGVLAIANIRGGGEYGTAWHKAGQFANRQNAYDDFIAAGEFLIAEGITPEGGLAIEGESNGGLLVGAVVNQRPDLFAAALPGVGVMDMLRYHRFTGGAMWISDFGSPEHPGHFETLLGYSPYHTIKSGTDYPAILATTADTDDRVVPGHTFKYVAALQADDLGKRPRLVRVETRAGHGAGMPLDKTIALYADKWAFAAYWTGLAVTPIA